MTFERTKSGQENRAAFHRVDYICYVEGGGGRSERSDDVSFWEEIFSITRPDVKVRCIARGGKPELEARARDIINKDIANSLVAIDADYDELLDEKLSDPRVLYTYGYSWENDIFCPAMVYRIFSHISKEDPISRDKREYIDNALDSLHDRMKWPTRADYYALAAKSSVFIRDKPGRFISICTATHGLIIKNEEVLKLCTEANQKTKPRRRTNLKKLQDILRHCVGKIYSYAVLKLIHSTCKKFQVRCNITIEHLRDLGFFLIRHFFAHEAGNPVCKHYRRSVSKL